MSRRFVLDKTDTNQLVKNALLVSLAAGLTFISTQLSIIDLGPMTPLVVPVLSTLIESVIKWAQDNTKK